MSTPARDDGAVSRHDRNGHAAPRQRASAARLPLTRAYELWLGSWERALGALAIATESGTLSTSEAGTHRAVIAAERELVTKQFTLLLGHTLAR